MQKINGTADATQAKFLRTRERMIHVSAKIVRHPKAALAEALKLPYAGPQFIAETGTTYKPGRNKVKRERRARVYGGGTRK